MTTAEQMAEKQRSISVAEFFSKNRHLLGFDNPKKSLLTTIKESVDNALDACEEARILPEIIVEIIDMGKSRYRVIIEDNGPGIVKAQLPNIFARLLYGSKFHSMKMSRGQQGIGISAAVMYGQLTTGRPVRVTSTTGKDKPAHYFELKIDTATNRPQLLKEDVIEWKNKAHGTRIELDIEAGYSKGATSVDAYLKQTAISNPHVTIIYTNPKAEQFIFPRVVDEMPEEAKEIKPHPYGVELGVLMHMAHQTSSRNISSFLQSDFSRVSSSVAKEILQKSGILETAKPADLSREAAEKMIQAILDTKIMAPPTDCISPIGAEEFKRGLKKEIKAEFYCATTRPPSVYRGSPFIIECAFAYGGELKGDQQAKIYRYANRVPLQYQQGACATTAAIVGTNFKSYGLQQSRNSLPVGPLAVAIHIASVWVPFTSESKEAIAHYDEIIKEMKLALQDAGRQLAKYVNKKKKLKGELQKRSYIEKYIPSVAIALKDLLQLSNSDVAAIEEDLKDIMEDSRGEIKDITHENTEYDEDFAKIGKEDANTNDEDDEGDEQ